MNEYWKVIDGYEDYMISNLGVIKSLKYGKEKILKQRLNKDRYNIVLSKNNITKTIEVHQLMAITFLNHVPNSHSGLIVDHINNNPLDNRLINLQLITHRENCSKDKKGSSKYTGVSFYKPLNKWRCRIRINGKLKHIGYFNNEEEAKENYNNTLNNI